MIRQAVREDVDALAPDSEGAVKLLGLLRAYGFEQPFVRLWCVTQQGQADGWISLLDGAATVVLRPDAAVSEELAAFLCMQPEIRSVRTSDEVARKLAAYGGWTLETGVVMTPGRELQQPTVQPEILSPRECYPVLSACFGECMPPFEAWYVDVSHRVRHGCCRIVGLREQGSPYACAMTTAECDGGALIGAVATLPQGRGKGAASANVLTLAHSLMNEGRRVYLSPKNEHAHALYTRIGFEDCGGWGSLRRP